jgi:glycosyltransferase involved in cell wall biosynthesis
MELGMPVSVIMPAFNAEPFIEAALRSLLAERDSLQLDIIVIDDGSTDRTREIVEAFGRDFGEIRLLRNPRKGIAAARNIGLDNLPEKCRFVTFLDADDMSYPHRIVQQRAALIDDPTIAVLYGRLKMFMVQDPTSLAPAIGSPTKVIRGPYLQASMYRREVIETVGRFDETFRQGCDTDFVLRVIDQEHRLVLRDEIATFYRRHAGNVTLNTEEMQREFMTASLRWVVRRRRRGAGLIPQTYAKLFLEKESTDWQFEK